MATLPISENLAKRIREAAERANLRIEDYLARMLERNGEPLAPRPEPDITDAHLEAARRMEPEPGTAAALLQAAQEANIATGASGTVARSREILENEWAEHIMRYRNEEDSNDG